MIKTLNFTVHIVYYVLSMLFHQKTKKFLRVSMIIVGILIIISMILLSFPTA